MERPDDVALECVDNKESIALGWCLVSEGRIIKEMEGGGIEG